jgi:hypothetical protein
VFSEILEVGWFGHTAAKFQIPGIWLKFGSVQKIKTFVIQSKLMAGVEVRGCYDKFTVRKIDQGNRSTCHFPAR